MADIVVGRWFAYWIGVGFLFLIFCVGYFMSLDYFQKWLDAKRAQETEGKQRLKLSVTEKARLHNELKARSMRPAVKLGAIRNRRGGNDAA